MPRSRRDRVVALTQTAKKGKEAKGKLIEEIREQADAFQYLWVFDVEHMRNNLLQEVRKAWTGSRSASASPFHTLFSNWCAPPDWEWN
jgi:mRNA turnover protein 4